uniref:Tetraspanin n=1 Tax=Heterorhabditis bacteriophora TaxID=37862 RepID=A0A1I7WS68_HETBA
MTIQRRGGDFAKIAMLIYTVLFWASGLILISTGLWMLLDPKRNYILDLVDFSEDDPLLTFASYIAIISGCATLFIGFIGCCGAMKRVRCLLVGFILCLFTLFMADIAIGTLALVYRNKFSNGQMPHYLKNLTNNRYNRDKWVRPLIDTIQFYVSSRVKLQATTTESSSVFGRTTLSHNFYCSSLFSGFFCYLTSTTNDGHFLFAKRRRFNSDHNKSTSRSIYSIISYEMEDRSSLICTMFQESVLLKLANSVSEASFAFAKRKFGLY